MATYAVRLPLKFRGAIIETDLDMLYPHALFSILYHRCRATFHKRMFNDNANSIGEFWRAQTDRPSYNSHPMHEYTHAHDRFAVPLFLHGDEVVSVGIGKIWNKAVDVVSWGSLIGQSGESFEKHFLVWLLFTNIVATGASGVRSMQILWRHLCWSLYWLQLGQWADRDAWGSCTRAGQHSNDV